MVVLPEIASAAALLDRMHGGEVAAFQQQQQELFRPKCKKYTSVLPECGEKMRSSYLGTQAVEVSPSGASGAGQQNWWSTVWLLRDDRKETGQI